MKKNLQADEKITSQKSLFGFPVASDICFYTSTSGTAHTAAASQPFQLHLGQRQFGSPNLPKFNEGNYVKISMQGTIAIGTTGSTPVLQMRVYIGSILVCTNAIGNGNFVGPTGTRVWDIQVALYPKTFSIVDFESINIYGSGKFCVQVSSGGSLDDVKGFMLNTSNAAITPAQLGDVRFEVQWASTTNSGDTVSMDSCSYMYGGFNT